MSILRSALKVAKRSPKKAEAVPLQAQQVTQDVYKKIELKAYELFEKRGRVHGFEEADWLQAEKLVREEINSGK